MGGVEPGRARAYVGPSCPFCRLPLDTSQLANGEVRCSRCGGGFEAQVFAAPLPLARVAAVAEAGPQEGTPCRVHAANLAVSACGRCGAFMCSLCSVDADGLTLCTGCFERLAAGEQLASARVRYRDYRSLVAVSALLALMPFWSPLAGPFAIGYGLKALRQRRELGDGSGRTGIVLLMIMGGLGALGGLLFYAFVFGVFD